MISHKQVKRECKSTKEVFLLDVRPILNLVAKTKEQVIPSTWSPIVQKVSDIFPTDLPERLPPSRDMVKLQIETGEARWNRRPTFQISPKELDHVKVTITDLLGKA
jgi:hypothetical protein